MLWKSELITKKYLSIFGLGIVHPTTYISEILNPIVVEFILIQDDMSANF